MVNCVVFLVDYAKGEIIQLVQTGTYAQGCHPSIIALSPKSDVVVIGSVNYLEVFDAHDGKLIEKIKDVFSDYVTNIKFDLSGKYLFVSGENRVRIFSNEFK